MSNKLQPSTKQCNNNSKTIKNCPPVVPKLDSTFHPLIAVRQSKCIIQWIAQSTFWTIGSGHLSWANKCDKKQLYSIVHHLLPLLHNKNTCLQVTKKVQQYNPGGGGTPDVKWQGWLNEGKTQNPKKSLVQKLTLKIIPCQISKPWKFQKALKDKTQKN